MSKQAKAAPDQTAGGKELPFEEALKKLEGIVESMESDELPLEDLLARFEEGTRLAKTCQAKLTEAELKIQQLESTRLAKICQSKLTEAELKIQQLETNASGELTLKRVNLADNSAAE